MLTREVYRGQIVWRRDSRPKDDWIIIAAPHLRIVSDALWARAQERRADARQAYLRSTDGRLWASLGMASSPGTC